jgi:di/tricarboxylate transporter
MAGSVGETVLNAGDLMLLLGSDKMTKSSSDIFLLKQHDVQMFTERKTWLKKATPIAVLCLLVTGITGVLDLFIAVTLALMLFIISGTLKFNEIRKSFDLDLAILLVASLAIGQALSKSGAAQWAAEGVMQIGGNQPIVAISLLFALTLFITAVISNAAALAIVFPLAVSLALQLHISTTPVLVAIAFAASADFMTPIGYQTNLMVYGPGNYAFKDFFRVGFPLTVLYTTACILFISWYYKI